MADFDLILPFQIEAGAVRGRLVRLENALNQMVNQRELPVIVSGKLAETAVLAASLAGALKYDGIFTLQIQGDGAVPLLIVDVTSSGDLRGAVRFDREKLDAVLTEEKEEDDIAALFGKGHLAFTVDQGPNTDRYQGIVELKGATMAECVSEYLKQSEQLASTVVTAVARPWKGRGWRAAALIVQRMPPSLSGPIVTRDQAEEDWNRASILTESAKSDELLDSDLEASALLHRLYHADGLIVYPHKHLRAKCRCSAARVRTTLSGFPFEEVDSMKDETGMISVTCEFCNTVYRFPAESFKTKESFGAMPERP